MKAIRFLLTLATLAALPAFAINVAEGPDFPNGAAGTATTLTLGSNVFSGSVSTPSDGQDRFDVTVPVGLRITQVTKTFNAGGGVQSPNISFNTEDLSGTGPGTFGQNYPLGAGTYSAIVSVGFSTGNAWSVTFTVGAAPNYTVTTGGGYISIMDDAGNGDTLTVSEVSAGSIKFAAAGRTFSVNGGALITGDSGNIPLTGVIDLTINTGVGNDTINVGAFSGTSFPHLTINGGQGDDTVNLNGDITFAMGNGLDLDLQNDAVSPGVDRVNVAAGANIIASVDGSIFVKCSRNVAMGSGSSLETDNASLYIMANKQVTATTGNFIGVNMDGATVKSNHGYVSVTGRGGDDAGGFQLGVGLFNGAQINGGNTVCAIQGIGGASTHIVNRGLTVYGAGSKITSSGGDVFASGTAGALGSQFGIGISVLYGGEISAGGSGQVLMDGTGGGASGSGFNMGVELSEPGSKITAGDGGVQITGTAGPGASHGVYVANSAILSVTGAGSAVLLADSISLDATSFISTTGANSSVRLATLTDPTRLDLGGADDNAGTPKALGLTDAELDRITTPRLIVSALNRVLVSAPVSPAAATNLTLSGSPILAAATGTDVTLSAGGVLQLDGPFSIPVTGAVADTGFPQLKIVGGLNLNGKALDLTGTTFAGTRGNTFTIIDNDGTDAVTGTFGGLTGGATPWPPDSTLKARVSYTGGSGNDVVLTLADAVAPALNVPANIAVAATSAAGAVVTFSASATDNLDPMPIVVAAPPNGSTFPIGTTTVNVQATDTDGNSSYGSFTVTVYDLTVTANGDSGAGSLRDALTAAAALPGANTITIAPALAGQTVTLSSPIVIGDADPVTIDASNLPGGLTIDGGAGMNRVFRVPAGGNLTLKALTLTGGNGAGSVASGFGGAVYCLGTLALEDCTVSGNTAASEGGGIYCGEGGSLTLSRCVFMGNSAYEGGAVRSKSSALTVTNCTFAGNGADIGGACSSANNGPDAVFRHVTISGNTAGPGYGGGGLFFYEKNATLTNCLIAGNTSSSGPDVHADFAVNLTSGGGNLIGDNSTSTGPFPTGSPNANQDRVGTAAAPLNAQLAPLAARGGLTKTMALLPGSPALDAGVVVAGLETDQRGFSRNRNGDTVAAAAPDTGAYEAQAFPFATGFSFSGEAPRNLAATDRAGAPAYAQGNWNNLLADSDGSGNGDAVNATTKMGAFGTAISGLKLWWDAPNTYAINFGTPANAEEKLMWGYIDSNNAGDGRAATDLYASAAPQPFFAVAGLPAAQIVGGYRVVVYSDGDVATGRIGEYWLTSNRQGTMTNVAGEIDLTNHIFVRDSANFAGTYVEVPASANSAALAADGNYFVFGNQTEPGFILRAEEINFRAPINAVQVTRNEIVVVTTAADELDPIGTPGTGVSLREAIRDAAPGSGIVFDSALFAGPGSNTVVLTMGSEIALAKNVTIDASNIVGGVMLSGGAGANRVFYVPVGSTATLLGLTLTDGNGIGAGFNGLGGAILNDGTLTLARCTLTGNTGGLTNAGGAIGNNGTLTLLACTLANNTSVPWNGGAIWNNGSLAMDHCTVVGNTGLRSGAIDNNGPMVATHCTFSGNSATEYGGAFINDNSPNPATSMTLINCIVAGNSAPASADILNRAALTFTGANLVQGLTPEAGTVTGTPTNAAPLLSALGDYGGPTQTMPPQPGSPAINVAIGSTATADQRGLPISGTADIGATERLLSAVVTTTADTGEGSLRFAMLDAASLATPATFAPGFTGPVVLAAEIVVSNTVTVDAGSIASGVVIDGGPGLNRIFFVAGTGNLSLKSLTLTGGNGGGTAFSGLGGAILTQQGSILSLTGCAVFNNSAPSDGGAIRNTGGNVSLTYCTVALNTASGFGGGIHQAGTAAMLTVTHCTFSGNIGLTGGGIRNGPGHTLNLANSIVAGNAATGDAAEDIFVAGTLNATGGNLVPFLLNSGGTVNGAGTISTADPRLAPLGNYGGPTQTMALRPGSPARDAAVGSSATADQRGFSIVGTADIGAYEAGTFTNYNAWAWETLPTAATVAQHDGSVDYDGDGMTNYNEWLALTNPGDPGSVLRITSVAPSGANVLVTFPSVSGRHYYIEYSFDFVTWANVPPGTAISGTGNPVIVAIGPVTGIPKLFFRVRVGP